MAKIIFYKSPIDSRQRVSLDLDDYTIYDILSELNIENESLAVRINGKSPDDVDLNYKAKDDDIIEISRMVHGRSSGSKRTLGGILQIAALVVATIFTSGWAAVAAITLSVAGGYLNAKAARMNMRNEDVDTDEIDSNNFSIGSASNEARALQPMPLPMGSIRFAPDYHCQPNNEFGQGVFETAPRWYTELYNPAISTPIPGQPGTMVPLNEWGLDTFDHVIPSGYFQLSPYTWPQYPVSIMPTFTRTMYNAMTGNQRRMFTRGYTSPAYDSDGPIVLYHHHPDDPNYGRVTTLWLMMKIADYETTSLSNALTAYDYFFGIGSRPSWWNFFATIAIPGEFHFILGPAPLPLAVPSAVSEDFLDLEAGILDFFLNYLNAGTLGLKDYPGYSYRRVRVNSMNSVVEQAYTHINHVFNYGLGEMLITDRTIEKTSLVEVEDVVLESFNRLTWYISVPGSRVAYVNNSLRQNKQLRNSSYPSDQILPDDNNTYNFVYYKGPIAKSTGWQTFRFGLDGQLFYASDSGMQTNSCLIEMQYKSSSLSSWSGVTNWNLVNDNTKRYRRTVALEVYVYSGDYAEVRIRKRSLDSSDNNGKRVATFEVVDFKFEDMGDINTRKPFNLEFLRISERTTNAGRTYKYTALVEPYCYVYDDLTDTWTWKNNRNPAWWFLYYARGGFRNDTAVGQLSYPYGTTYGWVNYADHPDNYELMFGAGLLDSEVDLDGIKEWAQFCDDNNLFFDGVIREDTYAAEILEKIANTGRANCTYQKGILGVIWQEAGQVPSGMFGMSNIMAGSFSVDYQVADKVASVEVNFVDRDLDWDTQKAIAQVPYSQSDNIKVLEVTLDGVTERQQAQREANILAARQFFQRRVYSWKSDQEGLIINRGDVIYLSHDATQYGYSGRITKFNVISGAVVSIETTSYLEDHSISHVTVRYPDGDMNVYECSVSGNVITFIDPYPINKASEFIDVDTDNASSDYSKSMPDDFIFIAGAKSTPGKVVRITEKKAEQDGSFVFSAVDEDPAMWSYEYGPIVEPTSFEDSQLVCKVDNLQHFNLGNGLVKIMWENLNTDYIKIINENNNMPIEANGSYAFSGGEVVLELDEGQKYNLRIEPFVVGQPYRMETRQLVVWA